MRLTRKRSIPPERTMVLDDPAVVGPQPKKPRRKRKRRKREPVHALPELDQGVKILALDPGASTGWAVIEAGRYVESGVRKIKGKLSVPDYLQWALTMLGTHEPGVVVYEAMLMVAESRGTMGQARPRVLIEAACALSNIPVDSIYPSSWQAHYKFPRQPPRRKGQPKLPKIPKEQLYQMPARVASGLAGRELEPSQHDEIDAVLLGHFYHALIVDQQTIPPLLELDS